MEKKHTSLKGRKINRTENLPAVRWPIATSPPWAHYYGIAAPTYLVPETRVVEPFQELLAHDHRAGEEGPVRQQEVLYVSGVHHWVFLHQMHGEALRCALFRRVVFTYTHNIPIWAFLSCESWGHNGGFLYLDDNVSLPGACAIQFPVFFYHNNLSFLFHLLHVFLYLVKNTAVVLLGYTHKLEKTRENNKNTLSTIILNALLFYMICSCYPLKH